MNFADTGRFQTVLCLTVSCGVIQLFTVFFPEIYEKWKNLRVECTFRVPTQVLQSLIKSYICFPVCKALQSLIFGVFFIQKVL